MDARPIEAETYLAKAMQSFRGAESEFLHHRYNNVANRAYYACFQAAVAAMAHEGAGSESKRSHPMMQVDFVTELIDRRGIYPRTLRPVLKQAEDLRLKADYALESVSAEGAARVLTRARSFLGAVRARVMEGRSVGR